MNTDLAAALERLWVGDHPTISSEGVAAGRELERQYAVKLPDEFATYLTAACPASDWMDNSGVIFWPPARICSVRACLQEPDGVSSDHTEVDAEADQYLIFADYLDWCGYGYAICCSDGPNRGKVAMVGEASNRFVANSLSTFISLVADDSPRLHSPAGDRFSELA